MAKKVLIVDDEPNIVKMLESRLSANGYEVVYAFDGKEGLTKAKEEKPDLIILDILMPKMDGGTVAEELKRNPLTANIPVIFLTCLVKKEEEQETEHEIGGHMFFAKPFDAEELLAAVDKVLKTSS